MQIYKGSAKPALHQLLEIVHRKSLLLREHHPFLLRHPFLRKLYVTVRFLPVSVFQNRNLFSFLFSDKLFVDHIEVVITTHCSLRCRHCANLIQYYKKPYHIPAEIILKEIDQFTTIADYVGQVRILGGEPLLHPELDEILKKICVLNNISSIEVVTNGTILPQSEALRKSLQHPKISLCISDYGSHSRHKKELVEYCHRSQIQLDPPPMGILWDDYGNIECRGRTDAELKQQLSTCQTRCYSLLKGKLHLCPHSSHGEDLGLFHCAPEEYVDILSDKPLLEKKKELYEFLYHGPQIISACNYCNNGLPGGMKKVSPGEQLDSLS